MSRTITRDQYVKACVAFWDAIGGDAAESYYPVLLEEYQITFPRAVKASNGRVVRAAALGFEGEPSDVLSVVTKIKVVD